MVSQLPILRKCEQQQKTSAVILDEDIPLSQDSDDGVMTAGGVLGSFSECTNTSKANGSSKRSSSAPLPGANPAKKAKTATPNAASIATPRASPPGRAAETRKSGGGGGGGGAAASGASSKMTPFIVKPDTPSWSVAQWGDIKDEYTQKVVACTVPIREGQGKKSAEEMEAMDNKFMSEILAKIEEKVLDTTTMPQNDEEELASYLKTKSNSD